MRGLVLFHVIFLIGGMVLYLGSTSAASKIDDWIKAALGEESRAAQALSRASGILVAGAAIALAEYAYYEIGLTFWGRAWHSEYPMWKRILGF